MTRKDYELIAAAIKNQREDFAHNKSSVAAVDATANRIANALSRDNLRFDRRRFLDAAGAKLDGALY